MKLPDSILSRHSPWKVLRWFLGNPSREIHVKGLARTLKISSDTASRTLRELAEAGLLTRRASANALLYSLNNDSLVTRQFKRLYIAMELERIGLVDGFLKFDDAIISLGLYGSFASGENDAQSDLDLILLTASKGKDYSSVLDTVRSLLKREPSLVKFSLTSWAKLKSDDPDFYGTIQANHLVLYGSQLP